MKTKSITVDLEDFGAWWESNIIKNSTPTPKKKTDWIPHRGNKCPVASGTKIDVQYRDGKKQYGLIALKDDNVEEDMWKNDKMDCDIVAWRMHVVQSSGELYEELCSLGIQVKNLRKKIERKEKYIKEITEQLNEKHRWNGVLIQRT